MSRLIDSLDRENVPLGQLVALVSSRNQQHNLRGAAKVLDEEQMVEAIELFGGTYLRFPPLAHVMDAFEELVLVRRWQTYKESLKTGDLDKRDAAWKAVRLVAKRIGIKPDDIEAQVAALSKEARSAQLWHSDLEQWAQDANVKNRLAALDVDVPECMTDAAPERKARVHRHLTPCRVVRCMNPAKIGRKKCAACAAKDAEANRKHREKRYREGNCIHCGQPRDRNGSQCRRCLSRKTDRKAGLATAPIN